MRSPMKLRKHVEGTIIGDSLDRISSLPDELLGQILSYLSTRSAVRTSILSTRWRYLYTLTNCLSFDDVRDWPSSVRYADELELDGVSRRMFRDFVYKVLESHQVSPIKRFSLLCYSPYDESDFDAWINVVLQKGVQELHFDFCGQFVLPDSLFVSENLVKLILNYAECLFEFEVPSSTWLPSLKILHLGGFRFLDNCSVERFFSGCKFLEELTLKCSHSDTGRVFISFELLKDLTIEDFFSEGLFEIDAPNLASLSYSDSTNVKIVPSWKDSCSLVKANLRFRYDAECFGVDSLELFEYDRELIKATACKATGLELSYDSFQLLLPLAEDEKMPDFHSLSRLDLGHCPYYTWKNLTSVLDNSPQLEIVTFGRGRRQCDYDPKLPPNVDLTPFSCHVKKIIVRSFCGHKCSLLLLGHLLRNAGVLKRLIVEKCGCVNMEKALRISKELLRLPRALPDCCIEFK